MLLTEAERAVLRERGIIVFEKCDTCGQPLLESFCWKFAGRPEVYCSQLCRDGVARTPGKCARCGASLEGKRRGARFCNAKCRMRSVRDPQKVQDSSNSANSDPVESIGCDRAKG